MKQTIVVAGHPFIFEALEGELTLNGTAATSLELRALGEAVHHVRVAADLQASAKRRKEKSLRGLG